MLRSVSAGERFVRRGLWQERHGDFLPLGSKIGGKRVGIVGLGSIGSAIARRLEAFGCAVAYHSRRPKDDSSYSYFPTARDLAARSDVLVVACALTAETRHIVDRDVLDAMGKGGVVVNVARGTNVDEAELVRAPAEGRVAGAGLEVFEDEPNVPAELLAMDNVALTPHQSVFIPESMSDLDRLIVGNLEAFFAGEPLLTPVVVKNLDRAGIVNRNWSLEFSGNAFERFDFLLLKELYCHFTPFTPLKCLDDFFLGNGITIFVGLLWKKNSE